MPRRRPTAPTQRLARRAAAARAALAPDDLRQSTAFAPVAQARQDIVIVDVDDASLRELGRWP